MALDLGSGDMRAVLNQFPATTPNRADRPGAGGKDPAIQHGFTSVAEERGMVRVERDDVGGGTGLQAGFHSQRPSTAGKRGLEQALTNGWLVDSRQNHASLPDQPLRI